MSHLTNFPTVRSQALNSATSPSYRAPPSNYNLLNNKENVWSRSKHITPGAGAGYSFTAYYRWNLWQSPWWFRSGRLSTNQTIPNHSPIDSFSPSPTGSSIASDASVPPNKRTPLLLTCKFGSCKLLTTKQYTANNSHIGGCSTSPTDSNAPIFKKDKSLPTTKPTPPLIASNIRCCTPRILLFNTARYVYSSSQSQHCPDFWRT